MNDLDELERELGPLLRATFDACLPDTVQADVPSAGELPTAAATVSLARSPWASAGGERRRHRFLLGAAASVAIIAGVGGLIWIDNSRLQPPAASSTPAGTSPPTPSGSTLSAPSVTIPAEFPNDVPRPDTFDTMTFMEAGEGPRSSPLRRVGWSFYDQGEPTTSGDRCTQYASTFDESWTSNAKTDEAPSAIYAQILDNGQWQVGIYCTTDGGYLVQVMPTNSTQRESVDALDPTSSQAPDDASLATTVVAILHAPDQRPTAEALADALRARGIIVDFVAESASTGEQTFLMPATEAHKPDPALDFLGGNLGVGFSTNFLTDAVPANVTDIILLGDDGGPTLPLPPVEP